MADYIKYIREKVGHDRVILVGAGIYVYKDGKVLLQRRKDNQMWGSNGGAVDIGERVEDTAIRELYEEAGLIAHDLELLGVFSGENMFFTYPNGDEAYIISIAYICRNFSGELLPDPDEVTELKWFDIDNLPEDISLPDSESLAAFVEYIKRNSLL